METQLISQRVNLEKLFHVREHVLPDLKLLYTVTEVWCFSSFFSHHVIDTTPRGGILSM